MAGASAAPAAQLKIAFVGADLPDPFYLTMKCGAFAAAKKYNVDLSWQGTDGVDFAPELAIYNATVQKKPDGIIVAPFSPTAFVKPVADTMKAGTPVVTVDGSLSKKVELQNIRTDNLEGGRSRRHRPRQGARRQGHGRRRVVLAGHPGAARSRPRLHRRDQEEASRT